MKDITRNSIENKVRPERIIQFGEGNFLRAFVDWIVWNMNEMTDFDLVVKIGNSDRNCNYWELPYPSYKYHFC